MRLKYILPIITAICIFSCNDAKDSETYRLLLDAEGILLAFMDTLPSGTGLARS